MGKRHISPRPSPHPTQVCILANRAFHYTVEICEKGPKREEPWLGPGGLGHTHSFIRTPPMWTHSFPSSASHAGPRTVLLVPGRALLAWPPRLQLELRQAPVCAAPSYLPCPSPCVCLSVCLQRLLLLTTNSSSNPASPRRAVHLERHCGPQQ